VGGDRGTSSARRNVDVSVHPKRKVSEDAVEHIHQILAWEGASESSKLFKTFAAAIDAEFERE
jgi:hypothetical protein